MNDPAAPHVPMIAPEMSFDELKENFALFDDWEDRYRYLIDLGRKLPPFPDALKTEAHKVRGCMSQVWMVPGHPADSGAAAATDDAMGNDAIDLGRFAFAADSDAHIVKGLIAVLGILFSGKTPAQISAINTEAAFHALGLDQHLSPSRRNGLVSMVEKIKTYAQNA